MNGKIDFSDWSTHLMQAEIQLKAIEHKLLHKDYKDISVHAEALCNSVDKTMAWVALQGANGGADVLNVLDFCMKNTMYSSKFHPILLAAKMEIEQLRSERQFWLKSGFEIGKSDAVEK